MKKILVLLIILVNLSCKAQTIGMDVGKSYSDTPLGGYYQDINTFLDPYQGTWLYSNGTISITIKLRKVIHFYNGKYYQDMLVGEYKYVENGVEKINTLNFFSNNPIDQFEHKLTGNYVWDVNGKPFPCNDCNTSIKRVSIEFVDTSKETVGIMYFGISNTNINNARVFIYADGLKWTLSDPDDNLSGVSTIVGTTIPNGWYNFTKQ